MKKTDSVEGVCVLCGQFVADSQLHTDNGKIYCKAHFGRRQGLKKAAGTKRDYRDFKKLINNLSD